MMVWKLVFYGRANKNVKVMPQGTR
jgi:hypothetical protein